MEFSKSVEGLPISWHLTFICLSHILISDAFSFPPFIFPRASRHLLSRGVASNWRCTPVSSRPPLTWASPSGRILFVGGRTCGDGILYWRLVLGFEWKCGSHCLNWRDWSEMSFRGWGRDEVDTWPFYPSHLDGTSFCPATANCTFNIEPES